ncbi:ATPase [Larkinella rosea]|uniref:ATPase n=2 Tax=Larkinella rosea TaxID=2025312 RepID=A0A3P1BGD0_9BACT|nr:ATPase [Larkinella rosea]
MDNNTESTTNFLNWVDIKNFKSIKDLHLDCKRVNVFIGKPNVGKSNILEALGLLGANYSDEKYLNGSIRYEDVRDLFTDYNFDNSIIIKTNQLTARLERIEQGKPIESTIEDSFSLTRESGSFNYRSFSLGNKGQVEAQGAGLFDDRKEKDDFEIYRTSPVKKYDFISLDSFKYTFSQYLLPPHGDNLYAVINRYPALWQGFNNVFQDQNLEFVLLDREQSLALQKKEGPRLKRYPYFSIADTFRRYIFYVTAIESNTDSVIVFEEPEVHSFPPYTHELAYRMIYDENNQYFISTHSPYMLHPFIEKMDRKDLNVFVTYYKDYQTHVRALTEEEFIDILDYSTNVFFNMSRFEHDG